MALGLGSALTNAQDGSPPGPPVTNPKTNLPGQADTAGGGTKAGNTTADILPGVPATRRDPAPPGTRAVRVDSPNAQVGSPGAVRGPATRGKVYTAEGVVIRIDRAGKTLNGELERFAFDPSQTWSSYVDRGAQGVADKDDARPKTTAEEKAANAKQHEDLPGRSDVMEMAISKRTYCYTYARDAEGIDQYGAATSSSPGLASPRSGLSDRERFAAPSGPTATNFTNMKEGSFVAVRYRKVGDVNEVLNLTLIEMPLNPGSDGAGAGNRVPNTTAPASGRTGPGGVREPSVPLQPRGPASPKG